MKRTMAWLILFLFGMVAQTTYADGDPQRGRAEWVKRCTSCHAVDIDRVGPRQNGILGREAGSVTGFNYSPALKAARFTWDEANLDRWLADPEKFVPGQRMFVSVPDADDRRDIITYLKTLNK